MRLEHLGGGEGHWMTMDVLGARFQVRRDGNGVSALRVQQTVRQVVTGLWWVVANGTRPTRFGRAHNARGGQ